MAIMVVDYFGTMESSVPGKAKLKAEAVITDQRTYTITLIVSGLKTILEGLTHKEMEAFCKEAAKELGAELVYPESLEDMLYNMDRK